MHRGVRGLSSQLAALIYTQMFQRMHGCINLHMYINCDYIKIRNFAYISKHPYPKCAGHKQNMPNVLLFAEGRKQKNIPVILRHCWPCMVRWISQSLCLGTVTDCRNIVYLCQIKEWFVFHVRFCGLLFFSITLMVEMWKRNDYNTNNLKEMVMPLCLPKVYIRYMYTFRAFF